MSSAAAAPAAAAPALRKYGQGLASQSFRLLAAGPPKRALEDISTILAEAGVPVRQPQGLEPRESSLFGEDSANVRGAES